MRAALVSIHDVMPETLSRVQRILSLLEEARAPTGTLLVVPGREWDSAGISALREMAGEGYRLAGHGWAHQAIPSQNLHHRLHALLISRDQAEHLSRSREELRKMVDRTFHWFRKVELPPPELYVPPAWAMGALNREDLKALPFRYYEVLRGLICGETGKLTPLPLVGFEADTRLRWFGLKLFNGVNRAAARWLARNKTRAPDASRSPFTRPDQPRPLRISIHPFDLEHLMGRDLEKMIREPWRFVREEEVMDPSPGSGISIQRNVVT